MAVEVAADVEPERLRQLNYTTNAQTGETFTPRNWKIDIYRTDVSGFSVQEIVRDAVTVEATQGQSIRVTRLEMLILMKHRAGMVEDVQALVRNKFALIDWKYLESISANTVESQEITNVARLFGLL